MANDGVEMTINKTRWRGQNQKISLDGRKVERGGRWNFSFDETDQKKDIYKAILPEEVIRTIKIMPVPYLALFADSWLVSPTRNNSKPSSFKNNWLGRLWIPPRIYRLKTNTNLPRKFYLKILQPNDIEHISTGSVQLNHLTFISFSKIILPPAIVNY